jgi:hypothetical protein
VSIEPISDHFRLALVKLVPPFWGKPVIAALLRSYINRVQAFEDDCNAVAAAFDINTCDATRLAVLGRVVGQPNQGWTTETYRAVVRAKIATNRSAGTENDLVNVVRLASSSTDPIGVTSVSPATVLLEIFGAISDDANEALLFLLPRTRSAGVRLHYVRGFDTDGLTWASSVTGGGGAWASSITGGGDPAFSVTAL